MGETTKDGLSKDCYRIKISLQKGGIGMSFDAGNTRDSISEICPGTSCISEMARRKTLHFWFTRISRIVATRAIAAMLCANHDNLK